MQRLNGFRFLKLLIIFSNKSILTDEG